MKTVIIKSLLKYKLSIIISVTLLYTVSFAYANVVYSTQNETPLQRVKSKVNIIGTQKYGSEAKRSYKDAIEYTSSPYTDISKREKETMILAAHNNFASIVEKAGTDILESNSCDQKKLNELYSEMKKLIKLDVKNKQEIIKLCNKIEFYNKIRSFVNKIETQIVASKIDEDYNLNYSTRITKQKDDYLSKDIKCDEIKRLLSKDVNKKLNARHVSFLESLVKKYTVLIDKYIKDDSGEFETFDDKFGKKSHTNAIDNIYIQIDNYCYENSGIYLKYETTSSSEKQVTSRLHKIMSDYKNKKEKEEKRREEERVKLEEEERIKKEKEKEEEKQKELENNNME